jgi:general secretion pathway protein I
MKSKTAIHIRSRGFTLIEVLAALMLIAIVIPAVMQGITVAQHAGDSARRRTEAAGLAQTQLATILAMESWQTGSLSGDFSPDFPNYQWKAQVAAWPGDTTGAGLQEIDLTVSWMLGGRENTVVLSTLAYPRNVAFTSSSSSSSSTQ